MSTPHPIKASFSRLTIPGDENDATPFDQLDSKDVSDSRNEYDNPFVNMDVFENDYYTSSL